MSRTILGIDIGTTSTKAALFDLENPAAPLAITRRHSATQSPYPSYSEADPLAVRKAVVECIRELSSQHDTSQVSAIGTSGTACGAWLFRDGVPVRPAILWNDGRAAEIVDRWHDDGRMTEIFEISGNVPFPGYTLAILRWLTENEPQNLAVATHLVFCKDWVRSWLTGIWGSDDSDASYVPFDIRQRCWDRRLFALADVSEQAGLLPEILPPRRTDPLLDSVAQDLGLPEGIPVALGSTDIVAGCIGGGAIALGHAVTILGTSAASSIITEQPEFEPQGVGIMAAAPMGRCVRTMVNTSGSMTLDWAAMLLTDGRVQDLLDLAAKANKSDIPVLLPYLAGTGVVSPFVDAKARGAFVGLRAGHDKAALCRAAVEGLAFAVADCYGVMPSKVQQITAIGGAARSDLLLQMIADTTKSTVLRPRGEEFGARGVALLAALDSGYLSESEFEENVAALDIERQFQPQDPALAERLERYQQCSIDVRKTGRLWS